MRAGKTRLRPLSARATFKMNKFKSGDIVKFSFAEMRMRIIQPSRSDGDFYDVESLESGRIYHNQEMRAAILIEGAPEKKANHRLTSIFS